jgi:hypothetical protein
MSILDLWVDVSESSFAGGNVVPLVHCGVLRSYVKITQTPLKRRTIIHGCAASQRQTRIDYTERKSRQPIFRSACPE